MSLVLVGFERIWNRALLAVKPALESLNFGIVYVGWREFLAFWSGVAM